jgi:hypothetical protein
VFIIDPIKFGNPAFNRPTVATYFDGVGALQNAAIDEFRITYDPKDLTSGPIALVEKAATNAIRNNTMQGAVVGIPGLSPNNWAINTASGINRQIVSITSEDGIDCIDVRFFGTATAATQLYMQFEGNTVTAASLGQQWVHSVFARVVAGALPGNLRVTVDQFTNGGGFIIGGPETNNVPTNASLKGQRYSCTIPAISDATTAFIRPVAYVPVSSGQVVDVTLRIGLPQLEQGKDATSPIRNSGVALTRAADVVGSGAALLYSNVSMTEAAYSATATYAAADVVRDPATNDLYESVGANNVGNALSDKAKWVPRGATNRWKMLDQYNNTQSQNADQIVLVLSPGAIAQGIFLAGLDAMEVSMVMQDPVEGIVYRETQSQVLSNSRSSYFNWIFKRILRKSYCVSVLLPPYWGALVTVVIKNLGSTAKCGMFALGPIVDVGLSEYGLSTEIKDYSSTTFEFDGTSTTVVRDFAKRMSVDLVIKNEYIDSVQEALANYRQKPVVWVGTVLYGSAIVFGRYSSFKNIIEGLLQSKMAMQIDGTV